MPVSVHPIRFVILLLAATIVLFHHAMSQLNVGGQVSAGFVKANDDASQYAYNAGRETFIWRLDLFGDAILSDHVSFFSNIRMIEDQIVRVDLLSIRVTDIPFEGLAVEAGKIDLPFLSLGERRFPKNNPFINLPLMNEHRTSLRSSDYQLWLLDSRYASQSNGIQILDQGLYDVGVKVNASMGIFDLGAALINGMVSATSSYGGNGLNAKHGLGKIVRGAMTPIVGLTIGASYGWGPFLREEAGYSGYGGYNNYNPSDYEQQIVGADIDFSVEHLSFYGQFISNRWKFSRVYGTDLRAIGYSAEGRYALTPRLSLAARVGELFFNKIHTTVVGYNYMPVSYYGKWDMNITRFEGAVGYRFSREVLVKVVYQQNETRTGRDPHDNVWAIQTVAGF